MRPVSFEVLVAPNQPIPLIPLTEVLGNGYWNFLQRCSQPKTVESGSCHLDRASNVKYLLSF